MILKFPYIPNIKDVILDKYDDNKAKREDRKRKKHNAYIRHITDWHEVFAWRPLRLTVSDENNSHWIFCERAMQKLHISNIKHRPSILLKNRIIVGTWTRYSSKEYFKKKLSGEIDKNGEFVDISHDSTNRNINMKLK